MWLLLEFPSEGKSPHNRTEKMLKREITGRRRGCVHCVCMRALARLSVWVCVFYAEGIDSAKLRNLSSFCVSARGYVCVCMWRHLQHGRGVSDRLMGTMERTNPGEKEEARDGDSYCVDKKFTRKKDWMSLLIWSHLSVTSCQLLTVACCAIAKFYTHTQHSLTLDFVWTIVEYLEMGVATD